MLMDVSQSRMDLSQFQSLKIRRLTVPNYIKARRSTYFEAPKLRKGQSGSKREPL